MSIILNNNKLLIRSDVLPNRAIHSLSEESFVNNKQNRTMVQNLKLGGSELSEEQVTDHLSNLWTSTQSVREDLKNNIRPELFEQLKTIDGTLDEDVLNNMVISDKEIKNEKGEVISGKGTDIKTKDDGSLYFVVDNVTPDNDGKTATYTMRIANPNVVGTSQMGEAYVDAQTAGITNSDTINSLKTSPASLAMEQAGKITFTVNEETGSLTIDSVQIQNDSSSLKKQAIQELVDMYPEYTVEWQNQTESDKAVFSDIESGNPRNTSQKTYGLNYREKISSDDADTAYVKRWLGNKFSEDNSENSLMATIVQAAAKARGLSGKEFIEKYLNEIQDSALDNDPNAKGYTKTERDAVTKQVKATIYAGKNADPSTFLHELHHTIMLMENNMKEFSGIYQKVKDTKQFRTWLEKNRDIILNSSSVRNAIAEKDKDGNLVRDAKGRVLIDTKKLDSLFSSGDKWTTAEFELEARIYEAYMRSGQTFNPTLTGFFRRVAETFRQIYRSLRNGFSSVRLNDEVVEYFDKLYGYDRETGTTSKLSGSGELTHLSDRLEKGEKTDTLKQGTETDEEEKEEEVSKLSASEQYRAVREQYYGTDKYMIAPNGKASNLSERQWIQVRTPNFLEWGGDWINDPEHASVILDENGEPKQLYHGSPSTGIEIFNNSKRSINGGEKGFTYLTDNANVADRFSREFEEGSSAFRVRPTGRVGEVYSLYAKMANPLDFRNLTEQNKNDIAETYVDDVFGADAEDRSYQIELTKNSMENALRYENYQLVKDYAESYLGNLSSYGYDGIIAPMGTRGELKKSLEYAVASPNQVKSVNNNGEFSLEDDSILKQEVEDALMQFIGEVGASNVEELPDALNNLSIAKQMEWSGMGEQYIWATTGWVKGADGKWRMEIPDIINNLDFDNEKGIYERYEDYYPYPLKDFINEKIVRIYPQLSDYKIMFYSGSDVNEEGAYSDKTIRINTSYFSEIKNTLVHELQHAIQEIEGFQNGGNPREIDSLVKSKISELQKIVNKNEEYIAPYRELNRALSDYITWVKALENPDKNVRKSRLYMEYGDWYVSKNKKEAHQQYLDAIEKAEPYYREQRENLTRMLSSSSLLDSKLIPEEYAYKSLTDISMDELSALQKSVYGKMERLAKGLGLYEKAADLAQYLSLGEYSASDIYRKLQGEVEARNATTRYNLNVHVSLPRKTEDISREEQFRIVDGDILKQENIIEAETELSEKYKDSFDKAGNKQFASENEESIIKEIVYSYPKHTVANGVQMLDGLLDDNHDMPMQKEYLTARLVKELLGEDLILLPRYMDRMLNRVAGYQRFDNYSLSDGISAVSKDGRTFEFKFVASPKKVVKNLNTALRKADVAVVITSISDSLDRINVSKVIGNGEAYIINVYDEKNIDIRHKNTSTKEWRLVHSDSKSGHGFDNSNRIVSIASELQKVKPEDQTPMDYSIYNREAEERNKAALEALQSQSEENIRAVAVSGDSLKQISDAEWVETAKRIALQAPSLEEFFRLYREQVENGDAEVSDLDTQMILSNLYRGEHLTDYSEDYYSDYEEDAPSSIDEDDDWTVEGPDDEDMEGSATSSYSDEPMPDDWLIDNEDTATASDDDWVVEGPDDEGTPSSATSSSDSSDMPDEVPDWFFGEDEVAETENSATETEQTIKDMEDAVTEVQKVVVDSDIPKKLSLDHSRSLDTSIKARAVEFSSILSASKEETIKFLQTLKEVNAEFFYNEPRIDPQLVTEEDVADEAVRRTAYDEFDSISKFIQNLIYDSKGAKVSRDLTKLSDRAWKIVAGQVAKNAEVYMDLYARASNNTEWAGDNSIEAKVLTELGITERDWNNASFYRRKMYLQDIADKQLREKISSGQVYDKELREYLARAEEKAETSLAEAKAIEESQKYIIEENKKTILKLSTEAKDAVDKISDLQKEQEEVQGKIDRLVIRMEQKLKKQGQSIEKETLDHDELIRRQNALKRRETEYRNALESITYRNVYIEIEIIPRAFSPGLNGEW